MECIMYQFGVSHFLNFEITNHEQKCENMIVLIVVVKQKNVFCLSESLQLCFHEISSISQPMETFED